MNILHASPQPPLVDQLKQMLGGGKLEVRGYFRGLLHAKAYLCWYENLAEPDAAVDALAAEAFGLSQPDVKRIEKWRAEKALAGPDEPDTEEGA